MWEIWKWNYEGNLIKNSEAMLSTQNRYFAFFSKLTSSYKHRNSMYKVWYQVYDQQHTAYAINTQEVTILHMEWWALTHWGLVMPYGAIDLGQHWPMWWLGAWRHQAITWTNVDLSLVRSSDKHMRAISQDILQPWITKITTKITYLKFI